MIDTLKSLDQQWFLLVNNQWQNGLFDLLCPFMRTQSNWYLIYAVVIYQLFMMYGKKAWWLVLTIAIAVLVSDQISGNLIKNTAQRLRPCNDPVMSLKVHLLVTCGQGYSFVSSHATNHFVVAFFLGAVFKNKYSWVFPVALCWAAFISFSQVYVGVHYPIDVICGALLGSLIGYITYRVIQTKILISTPQNSA